MVDPTIFSTLLTYCCPVTMAMAHGGYSCMPSIILSSTYTFCGSDIVSACYMATSAIFAPSRTVRPEGRLFYPVPELRPRWTPSFDTATSSAHVPLARTFGLQSHRPSHLITHEEHRLTTISFRGFPGHIPENAMLVL